MKNIKRIFSAAAALLMALSFTACHKKDEIAVTVGDIEFTSAYYMCALINADAEAKSKVEEAVTEADADADTSDIDYYSEKIDGKSFVEWVEDTALDYLKEIAAYKTLCAENELEVSDDDKSTAEMYAEYYWSSYGYSSYFEPNGVGEATYKRYMLDSYYSSLYFEHLYAEGGEKEIALDKVKEELYGNFVIADMLQSDSLSSKTDDEKAEVKNTYNTYYEDLKNGKKTFEEIYKEVNASDDTEETTEETEDDTDSPKDKYASLLGSEDTSYTSDHYETVKAMALNEVKLVELEDDGGYVILVKRDIEADDYYLENLDITVRHMIADDEYEEDISKYATELECKVNNYAVKQFKVKKIKVPEAS